MLVRQLRLKAYGGAWIAALLLLCPTLPGTDGQELTTPPVSRWANPPLPGNDTALPQVTITGKTLQRAVDHFISNAMGVAVRSQEHPVARWRQPICPLVAGLSSAKGQFLFDRLAGAWASLGIPVGASGCHANFFVLVSANPEADLNALWHHAVGMFGEARGARSFIDTPRPVRIWYNTGLIGRDGTGPTTNDLMLVGGVVNGLSGLPTFREPDLLPDLQFDAIPELTSVIAVVDFKRVVGLDWQQVADYIAVTGLTQLKLDADVGEVPSILRLFTTSGDARPQGLTAWDKAFIKELYATDTVSRGQRVEMAQRMCRDLAAP
jgi:hypothetical protein